MGEDEKSGRPEQDTGKMEVHRLKGIVRLTDGSARMIQGVRDVYDITELAIASEVDSGKLVIIGRGMNSLETQGRVASSLLRALK